MSFMLQYLGGGLGGEEDNEVGYVAVRQSVAVEAVKGEGNQAVKMDDEAFPVSVYAITRKEQTENGRRQTCSNNEFTTKDDYCDYLAFG